MSDRHPFEAWPGHGGVVVRYADRFWYLREWHSHPRLEMNLVIRGNGSVLLEDRKYVLMPGHLIWLWPGQKHIPARWSNDMLVWIIEWDYRYFDMLKRARGKGASPACDYDSYCCRRLTAQALTRMQGILAGVAGSEVKDTFNTGLRFVMLALWDEFLNAAPVDTEEFLHPKLEKVLVLLNDVETETTLAKMAEEVGLSPHYLSVLFQKQTGMTIPVYRNRIRMNRFFNLYHQNPEMNLMALALDAGFGSYAQFYRIFTKLTGQTPKAWLHSVKE